MFNAISLPVEPGPGVRIILPKRYPLDGSVSRREEDEVICCGKVGGRAESFLTGLGKSFHKAAEEPAKAGHISSKQRPDSPT